MYKINLHAHSIYSDGCDTIKDMAKECKYQGFSACVITDHVYRREGMSLNSQLFEQALVEAKQAEVEVGIPVILGAEFVYVYGHEVLVFGTDAIRELLIIRQLMGYPGLSDFKNVKQKYRCGMILCHPGNMSVDSSMDTEVLDGFELYNSGCLHFRDKIPNGLKYKTPFANSDAHWANYLCISYNETEFPVCDEHSLLDLVLDDCPTALVTRENFRRRMDEFPLEPLT